MRHKTQSVLSVQGVTKRFDGLVAVSKMSFHVAAQEMVGVIGPNGSGKTTVMNLISGVYTPSEGGFLCMGARSLICHRNTFAVKGSDAPFNWYAFCRALLF